MHHRRSPWSGLPILTLLLLIAAVTTGCDPERPQGTCTPECGGKACGDDGCGGSCGTCADGEACQEGVCGACTPDCAGKECGDDGCGGSCGACADGAACEAGSCVATPPTCGDGTVDPGETCDPPGSCPTTCDDGVACTIDTLVGSAADCTAACSHTAVAACMHADGCCPAGCTVATDDDCTDACGDGVIGPGETCDPPGSCPTVCDDGDACTADLLSGSPETCNVACTTMPVIVCLAGDGCCPSGCDASTDADCPAACGDGVLQEGESCDPPGSCPTTCDDGDACTSDTLSGSAATCTATCTSDPIVACDPAADGCCPAGCDALTDADCAPVCGNGVLEPGETCDPQGTCPASCDDGDACTADTLSGSAETCTASCDSAPITACSASADGCCPGGCSSLDDADCQPVCGNGVIEAGETCDGDCPATCDDDNSCTLDLGSGTVETCTRTCSHTSIVPLPICLGGDGCCAPGCTSLTDSDCPADCGNGIVEDAETCDPPGSCPTSCDDGNACTIDSLSGSATTCNTSCSYAPVTSCGVADGCCPGGCNSLTDPDCAPSCGNGVLESGETCDPPGTCPTSCSDGDACTADQATGSAATCDLRCESSVITACAGGDGCCPSGCTAGTDSDCPAVCGDGKIEGNETCDPPETCPTSCSDGDACTVDTATGTVATCDVRCTHTPAGCGVADGCCSPGCDANTDPDCTAVCGNSVVEPGETCDPQTSCPTTCDDGSACTVDLSTGTADSCNLACSHTDITSCQTGDGCCPGGCDATTDGDCGAVCGNGILEPGETCEGDCPTSCDDGNVCTTDTLSGSAASCTSSCSNTLVTTCGSADGCCPGGCNNNTDGDCAPVCGNGVIEAGETCDGNCPTSCDDGNSCTTDTLSGDPAACTAVCSNTSTGSCSSGDGCCPAGCDATTDGDCSAVCGNGVVEPGESCDGNCPTSCDDGNACTLDGATGSAATCDLVCSNVSAGCQGGDGCCAPGCDANTDSDCAPSCGNGVVEAGETCDGNCPASCDDGNACTDDYSSGTAATCDLVCNNQMRSCGSGDGCCPSGCYYDTDTDCPLDCRNPATWPPAWAAYEQQVHDLTNQRRAQGANCDTQGVFGPAPPVAWNADLQEAARCHSLDMGVRNYFSHTNPDGLDPFERMYQAGYTGWAAGENIAAGYATPSEVVAGWVDSDGHCRNIMDPDFNELGVGYAFWPGSMYGHYWTQNFGIR